MLASFSVLSVQYEYKTDHNAVVHVSVDFTHTGRFFEVFVFL